MEIRFDGKVAFVTGAGRGIGAAVAVGFAESGADVALLDVKIGEADEVVRKVRAAGRRALCLEADVSSEPEVRDAFARARDSLGRVDLLVNNAGITRDGRMKRMTEEQFMQVIRVNLLGTFLCAREAAALMREAGDGGSIVSMSSVSPFEGNIGQVNYSASKMGVLGLTRTLSRELARDGIRVNAVAPGFTDTPMTQGLPDDIRAKLIEGIPLKRSASAEDIAGAVLFLSSGQASFITGQILHVNGGAVLY